MKTFVSRSFFCCLLLSINLLCLDAQSFEHCWQKSFFSNAHDVAYSAYDDTWIVSGQNGNLNNWSNFDVYVAKFDNEGNLMWQVNNLTNWEIGDIREILPLPNGDILVGGSAGLCDVEATRHLFKLNSEGEILWEENEEESWNSDSFSEFHFLSDNQVLLLGYSQISLMDLEGNFDWSISLGDANYSSPTMVVMNDDQWLVGGRNFLRVYASEDGSLLKERIFQEDIIWQADLVFNVVKLEEEGEYLALIDNNTLLRIDENLTTLDSLDLSDFFETSHHLSSLPNQRIGLLGKHQGQSKVLILDESFNTIKDFYFGANPVTLTSIEGHGDLFAVAGTYPSKRGTNTGGYPLQGSSASFIKVLSINDENNYEQIDAGIEKVEFGATELLDAGSCWNWGNEPLSQILLEEVEVTLKNYGELPIEDIQVNFRSDNYCQSICSSSFTIKEKLEGKFIEAGADYVLSLSDITIPNKLTQQSYEICFWTSIPNEKIDMNDGNDLYCETLFFTNIEEQSTASDLQIYPNPSQDKFTIDVSELPLNEFRLEVLNLQGQLLQKTYFSQKTTIDLGEYPTGIYWVRVLDGDGFNEFTKKIFRD